jgi:hypothetical protein
MLKAHTKQMTVKTKNLEVIDLQQTLTHDGHPQSTILQIDYHDSHFIFIHSYVSHPKKTYFSCCHIICHDFIW